MMRTNNLKKSVFFFLCLMMAVVLFAGCSDKKENGEQPAAQVDGGELGQGEKQFSFTVTDAEGNETIFIINTDKKTVGEALLELGLLEGEAGPYGLYVKTVNGITVDYDTDGKYWSFYVDGQYALSGVDMTDIVEGASYSFKVEK